MTTQALIVLNWKMNVPKERIPSLARCIAKNSSSVPDRARIIVCPSHDLITSSADALKKSCARVFLGAQNCAQTLWGAHTGEVSPRSLKRLGCSHVIIGHSERRMSGLESNDSIREKIELLLGASDLPAPILCIGEQSRIKSDTSAADHILVKQLEAALGGVAKKKLKVDRLVIAYEPAWAISTSALGPMDVPLHVWKMRHDQILRMIQKLFSRAIGHCRVPILYGGNVNEKNVRGFLEAPSSGVLVGGASQQVDSLSRLFRAL